MIDYTVQTIARLEYEERVRSMSPVHDYDVWIKENRPGWASKGVGAILSALKNGVVSAGERLASWPGADAFRVGEKPDFSGRQERAEAWGAPG